MTLILSDVNVFVGDGTVLHGAQVQVDGPWIGEITTQSERIACDGDRVECGGAWLLPGLIDAHVHLCLDGSADPFRSVTGDPAAVTAFRAARHAEDTLMAGFTTVRDLGEAHDVVFGLKQAIARGIVPGPRILNSGKLICMTGGHGWPIGLEADGADGVRRAARQQIKAGVDVIKLMATGGVMTPGVQPGCAQLTLDELTAGVEEARKAGKTTATHAQGAEGIMNAVRAGIDSVEHGFQITDDIAAEMLERGTYFVPTLSTLTNIEAHGAEAGIPDFVIEKTQNAKKDFLDSVRRARETGIRVAMGTDAGTPFNRHGQNAQEMEYMVREGFSPAQALAAATLEAAKLLKIDHIVGTAAPGKRADLVLVDGDPLADVSLLRNPESILMVIQDGRVVRRSM
jgi:imidazolonepropionase-like amidohydrolase